MIVSHQYRYIFIKTAKTAGTSVEIALCAYCGPEDIITPIHPTDETMRSELGVRGPQNCYASASTYRPRDVGRLLAKRERKLVYHAHISAAELRARIGAETFDGYYKFCIERNPFDRIISSYYWRRGANDSDKSLHEFVAQRADVPKKHGFDLYTIDGEVVVDRVLRYENLQAEVAEVADRLGFPSTPELPRTKVSHRSDRRPYQEVLTAADRAIIEATYKDELELFDYRF